MNLSLVFEQKIKPKLKTFEPETNNLRMPRLRFRFRVLIKQVEQSSDNRCVLAN